jgi:5-methyltetrahydrofolate--homocysteine methyltransferase
MISITELVKSGRILVSDGAWGTFLQKKGLLPGECPEFWNIHKPGEVFDIAKGYIDAGADMIETNSFGANSIKLSLFDLSSKASEINQAAAEISRKAAGTGRYVLGSIGPTGKILITGDVSYDELYEAFKNQAMALQTGGADALIIETMSDIEEAKAAIRACKENTSCEIICTMTFGGSQEGAYYTMMGVTPTQMAEELVEAGAVMIGANCGTGIRDMIGIVKEIRTVNKTIPVLINANAGAPVYKDGKTKFPDSPGQMAAYVPALIDAGANIIGGCCGTTPDHIRMIRDAVRKKETWL